MAGYIVIFTRSLPFHSLGGMEVVAWDLAQSFVKKGKKVAVITTSLEAENIEIKIINGVEIIFLQNTPSGKYSNNWWMASRKYFVEKFVDNTDTVLSVSAAAFNVLDLKRDYPQIKMFMQAHGTSWGELISKLKSLRIKSMLSSVKNLMGLIKDLRNYNKFDKIIPIGKQVENDLKRKPITWFLPQTKVCRINNGIDTDIFRPAGNNLTNLRQQLNIPLTSKIVISASRLHVQKGSINSLHIFSSLLKTDDNYHYLIAGDGPESENLKNIVKTLHLENKVTFLGRLQRDSLANYLQLADVFLFLTERVEGLPLNVLEALASGTSVIVSDHVPLFDSANIYPVNYRNQEDVISKISQITKSHSISTSGYLPREYHLDYATEKYIEAFDQ